MQDADKGMVERVAQALWEHDFPDPRFRTGMNVQGYVERARAAIAAMREPLRDALYDAIADEYFGISDVHNALDEVFDAALNAEKTPTEAGAK